MSDSKLYKLPSKDDFVENPLVFIHVAEFTDKVTGKVTEYHYVSKADYDELMAENARLRERAGALEKSLLRFSDTSTPNPQADSAPETEAT